MAAIQQNKQLIEMIQPHAIKQRPLSNYTQNQKAFFTDVQERDANATKLTKYVNNLESKIDYAKWKQNLVLKYNYIPMKRITEKVQNERANYVKKIAEEEANCMKMLSGKEITVQLQLFRQFSKKLDQKMKQIEINISGEKLRRQILTIQVNQKRRRLKEIMKENMETIKMNLINQGITTKEDLISLVRSKSTRDKINPTSMTTDSHKLSTDRKKSASKIKTQQTPRQILNFTHLLYEECLIKLTSSIQSMKSSEDIQSGIYLDIMQKTQRNNYSTEGRYSLKSKICDTILSKFGANYAQHIKNSKAKADFQMDWQTFKQLNWKQIMGIVMVKDKNCQKLKKLLKYK